MVMEYLHRVLQNLDLIPNFNDHPKCDKLKINNICFANESFLFVRGDLELVRLMMDKFIKFSNAIGLKASIPKYKIYF